MNRQAVSWFKRRIGRLNRRRPSREVASVAFNQTPFDGPWGGSNQFVAQMTKVLQRRGYRVCYELEPGLDIIFLIDPRHGSVKPFGTPEIAEYKQRNPQVRIIHRINECDARKKTDFMDDLLHEANRLADHTVFISEWLRDYHSNKWFDSSRSHSTIYNGADPSVFYPSRETKSSPDPLRLVTHHWSSNWLKGFDVYEQLDRMIAEGQLSGVEFTVIGRWPESIQWQAAATRAPLHGPALASELRRHDAYITASRWEPCGMSHVEGIQCGLPVVFHEDGGGVVEKCNDCGVAYRQDLRTAVEELRGRYRELRTKSVRAGLSGDRMTMKYADIVHALIFDTSYESSVSQES